MADRIKNNPSVSFSRSDMASVPGTTGTLDSGGIGNQDASTDTTVTKDITATQERTAPSGGSTQNYND